jgi:glutathione synthase/RimK-type ligase-like ATP-grasp enzyme
MCVNAAKAVGLEFAGVDLIREKRVKPTWPR